MWTVRRRKVRALTAIRHETIVDDDYYHQFTLIAGPARELVHGRYPELPLGIFAEDTVSVKGGNQGRPGARRGGSARHARRLRRQGVGGHRRG
ncbi:hypothetical protein [Rhodococcus artemisiae]|uniref:Uncharacterized protein n=1 Tax=Rhodococcus artemisiae TaxID=714159 RepID=A0ABU7LM06_9NOCA|nr:hypothetical protein [Rhodococcus artemisiae]MEE2062279.1 hypothetical protein [Rhodococcus artemisiae]